MWQVSNLILCTLLLWVMMSSCANKSKEKSDGKSSITTTDTVSEIIHKQEKPSQGEVLNDSTALLDTTHAITGQSSFKYNLSQPDQTSILGRELIEISALTYDKTLNVLYAVNDEKGTLYTLSPENGDIIERKRFGKKGDYEGVEVGEAGILYAVQSNGDIWVIQKSSGESNKIKTALHASNDVEGLGYNKEKKLLLLACKGYPAISKSVAKSKSEKAIYGWSTETETLIEEPILTIQDDDLITYLESLELDISKSKKKKFRKRLKNFSPSGIAFNESENLYYLISSVGKTLIKVDQTSTIHHVEFLDDTYFAQPEGICFGKDNALYISNEGRGLVAKLMKFNVQ